MVGVSGEAGVGLLPGRSTYQHYHDVDDINVIFIMIKTHRPVINSTSISAVSTNKNPAKEVCSSILTKLIHDVLHLDTGEYDGDGNVDCDDDVDDNDDDD